MFLFPETYPRLGYLEVRDLRGKRGREGNTKSKNKREEERKKLY